MKQQGFTLIELLVVIGIITIIVGIATASFRTASATMRDGKRKADITALAKSLEASKNYATKLYKYNYMLDLPKDFPTSLPGDPRSDWRYCIAVFDNTTTPPPVPPTNFTSVLINITCLPAVTDPDSGNTITYNTFFSATYYNQPSYPLRQGRAKSWTLCANLEREGTPYCIKSLNR